MRPLVAGAAAAVVAAVLLVAPGADAAEQGTQCQGADVTIAAANVASAGRTLLCEVNVYRAANGLPALTDDPALDKAARGHSAYMERTKQFAHEGIGDGTPSSRAADAGFQCGGSDCVGENIAYSGFPATTPTDMFQQWRNSPPHNANMLSTNYLTGEHVPYVTAGMGFAVGPNYGTTGTQNFSTVSNGATDTAADLLTSTACDTAESAVQSAKARVEKAKAKVAKAKDPARKRKAKQKLRKAKAGLKDATGAATSACDLTY